MDTKFHRSQNDTLRKSLRLTLGLALLPFATPFAQSTAPVPPAGPTKAICIMNGDTVVMKDIPAGSNFNWTQEGQDGAGTNQKVMIIVTDDQDMGDLEKRLLEEHKLDPNAKPGEQKVVKKVMVQTIDDGQGAKTTTRRIEIINGDTVVNENTVGDEVEVMQWQGEGSEKNMTVDVDVRDNGSGTRIVVVKVRKVMVSELEGDEAAKFAPKKSERLNLKDFEIYPNPNQGQFNLRFKAREKAGEVTVRVTSIDGKVISEDVFTQELDAFDQKIDLGDVAPGVYLLSISQGDSKMVKRIVVE